MFGSQRTGFTLLEVLVVTSLLGVMSSILLVGAGAVNQVALDTKRVAEMRNIRTAMESFIIQNGRPPFNYNCNAGEGNDVGGTPCGAEGTGGWGACDGILPGVPGGGEVLGDTMVEPSAFVASMQELVDAGMLAEIPRSPTGEPGYCYHNRQSAGGDRFAIIMTMLPSNDPSTEGLQGSCRPWAAGVTTWCTEDPSTQYCLCFEW